MIPAEELRRVVPVIEGVRRRSDVLVSVDTSHPEVMRAAAAAGVDMINDVRALTRPGALATAAALGLPVCLMHMQGEPATMQARPSYGDVVVEVREFLRQRIGACVTAGLPRASLIIDPGFGFGKSLADNLALLRGLPELLTLDCPVLAGLSRKSLIDKISPAEPSDRLGGSLALALAAVQGGARLVRVHDVRQTVQALRVATAIAGR